MTNISYVTEQGLERLKKELEQLETVERPKISQQIAEARDKGDLSENAEYDAAKEAQGMLEMKINKLKEVVAHSRVLDQSLLNTSTVQILNKVQIKNKKNDSVMQYTLVSESEANLKEGRISVNTPIAKALLGKKVGDVVTVVIPSGTVEFEVMEISL